MCTVCARPPGVTTGCTEGHMQEWMTLSGAVVFLGLRKVGTLARRRAGSRGHKAARRRWVARERLS